LDRVAAIEAVCFPAPEAATRKLFEEWIETFPDQFFVAETNGLLLGFINGCVTNSDAIYDELFHSPIPRTPNGFNLGILGLAVIPKYRGQRIGALLMNHFIQTAKNTGRRSVILTCKDRLIHYYESFGYVNSGISQSTHGGAQWFDMSLAL
jgi:GNAT superfamily N-acetyltransferase